MRPAIWASLLFISLTGLPSSETTLVYTANRHGEIEPCGCQIKEMGGLAQMAERVSQIKKSSGILFLDAGNTFFSAPKLSPGRKDLESSRADLIARSYQTMGLFAFSPGESDFAEGPSKFWDLLKKTGATGVSANLVETHGKGSFAPFVVWRDGALKIAVTGLSHFELSPLPDGVKENPALPALKALWKSIEAEKPDQVVVLSHLGRKEDEVIAKEFPGVFVIGSKTMDYLDPPMKLRNSFIFEVGIEGQRLGEILLKKGTHGWIKANLTDLGVEYDKPNEVKKLVRAFKSKKPKKP